MFVGVIVVSTLGTNTIAENYSPNRTNTAPTYLSFANTSEISDLDDQYISISTLHTSELRDKVIVYKSVKGDTVESVAKKFNLKTQTILWANRSITTNTPIKVDSHLNIPPIDGVVHKVEAGDNIYALAKKYRVDPQAIVDFPFNEFKDESFTLIAGTDIMIHGGSILEQKKAPSDSYGTFAQVVAGIKGTSSFIWPTNGIITQYPSAYHMALDIANAANPPVIAADAGTVVYSGCFAWGYGCHVIIDHNNGYRSRYAHLLKRDVEEGAIVSQGQQIGIMGSTGRSTGTHLHFEIMQSNNTLLNPQNFLK
jgi:murein DD-endopeptidase MepM/ murein hydrolase activator NlpD